MSESRHLRSVSDLYAADEIEVLLLEEIRELEPPPAAYSRPEDIQDFEIAGSRTGGRISAQSSDLDSPGIHSTVHSWDSHANYHGNYGNDRRHGPGALPWPRSNHLIFYCDVQGHLKTATGFVRLLLLVSSAACLATLCSSGTAKVSLFMLPLVGRLRLMIFVAVFCLLITALLLFLDISHVIYVFPFNWARLNAWIFTSVGISFVTSSALLILAILEYHGGGWVPRRTRSQLWVTAGLGLFCAFLSLLLSWIHGRSVSSCRRPTSQDTPTQQLYKPVDSSSSGTTLKESGPKKPPSWVIKNSKKRQASLETNNSLEHKQKRKDHWASARQHFLTSNQFEEDSEDPQQEGHLEKRKETEFERRRQRRRREAEDFGGNGNLATSKTATSFSDETKSKKVPPKKLPLQNVQRPHSRSTSKDNQKPMASSSSRSEPQDYWLKGFEDAQRAEKQAAVLENWQQVAAKTLEQRQAQSTTWSEKWRPVVDDVRPCSSKTVETFPFT